MRPRTSTRTLPVIGIWLACALTLISCDQEPAVETTKIGILLPYTGGSSALAANMEKGAIFASLLIDELAARDERPFSLVFANTAGTADQATKAATELVDAGVVAVIGPGGDEVVAAAYDVLSAHEIPLISPLASTALPGVGSEEAPWIRLSASTEVLGASLANVVSGQGHAEAAIVVAQDDYHRELGDSFIEQYTGILDRSLEAKVEIIEASVDISSLSQQIVETHAQGVDAFVLAMHPVPAAKLLMAMRNRLGTASGPSWFLTPRLKTEVLVVNSSAAAIGHAFGVSSDFEDEKITEFAEAFDHRFGVAPLEPTYFVFDTTVALLLAIDRIRNLPSGDSETVAASFLEVTKFGGIVFDWTDLDRAKALYREGRQGQFVGLTGTLDFFPEGERRIGTTKLWEIKNGVIANLE